MPAKKKINPVLKKIVKQAQRIKKQHPGKPWKDCLKMAANMRYS